MITKYEEIFSIPSGVERAECDKLFELAKEAKHGIIEIGSWMGRSSCALAFGSLAGNKVKVHCIDKWKDFIPEEAAPDAPDVLANFLANTLEFRKTDIFSAYQGESKIVCKLFEGKADLLFIDGDHSYAGVSQDLNNWEDHLTGNWKIVFHDYGQPRWPDVKRFVDELEIEKEVVHTLAIIKKERGK